MRNHPRGVLIHGAGWVATQHLAAYEGNARTRVVAISSRSRESARGLAERSGRGEEIAIYDDLEAALGHEGVEIVSICTPQHVHCENTLAAAAAGKHLVIEKPAAISIEELHRMRAAVERAGVKTIVSFVLRWNPLFRTLKKLIARGALGEIYRVEADYLSYSGDWWGGWEEGRQADTGVSAMTVAGCHAIDALRWFAAPGEFEAARPREVFAYAGGKRGRSTEQYDPTRNTWHEGTPLEYDGLEVALVRFENGVLGKIAVDFECIQPYAFPLAIFGDRGSVRDNRLWSHLFPGQDDWVEIPAIGPDSSDVSHHPFQAQIDHFVDCLERDVESHCNLADAIETHEVIFAAAQCYRSARPVQLPLPG